jgi:magnesium chelatase family protein
MNSKQLEKYCVLDDTCKDLLENIIDRLGLSARAYTRIIKIARTIADLADAPQIQPAHLSEAALYRFLDRRNILDL